MGESSRLFWESIWYATKVACDFMIIDFLPCLFVHGTTRKKQLIGIFGLNSGWVFCDETPDTI